MEKQNIEKVNEILNESNIGQDFHEYEDPTYQIFKNKEFDSLDFMEAVINIEKQFDIQLPDTRLEKLETFQDLYNLIDEVTADKNGTKN